MKCYDGTNGTNSNVITSGFRATLCGAAFSSWRRACCTSMSTTRCYLHTLPTQGVTPCCSSARLPRLAPSPGTGANFSTSTPATATPTTLHRKTGDTGDTDDNSKTDESEGAVIQVGRGCKAQKSLFQPILPLVF